MMHTPLTLAVAMFAASTGAALAGPSTIWAVDASASGSGSTASAYAEQFDTSGNVLKQVNIGTNYNPTAIALVGNTGYVSSADSGVIRSFNLQTGALGASINTGLGALGSLSADATGFWASDYTGGNQVYHITLTGQTDRAIRLGGCGDYCNSDVFSRGGQTFIISNRGVVDPDTNPSSTYDLYDASGNVVTTALLANVPTGTGVAYNGDGFTVASAYNNSVSAYSFSGTLLSTSTLGGPVPNSGFGDARFVSDIAYAVPEPLSLALLTAGVAGATAIRRRR